MTARIMWDTGCATLALLQSRHVFAFAVPSLDLPPHIARLLRGLGRVSKHRTLQAVCASALLINSTNACFSSISLELSSVVVMVANRAGSIHVR